MTLTKVGVFCIYNYLFWFLNKINLINTLEINIMAVKSEKVEGKLIICELDSSNLTKTIYDTENQQLTATFKNGSVYQYENVPHKIFVKFRMAESQGKFFNTEISKKYSFKKMTN